MAQFLNKDSGLGWDAGLAGAVPWQMVPMGGARGIKLIGGADLQIRCRPANIGSGAPDGLTYSETALTAAAHREIWLQGRQKGQYVVEAFKPESGIVVAMLGAGVFPLRTVKVAYYTLPAARKWDTKRVNDVAHNILFPQANVKVEWLGHWGNEFGYSVNLPQKINIVDDKQRDELRAYGDAPAADLKIYFAWTIQSEQAGMVTNAITYVGRTVVDSFRRKESEIPRMGRTVAHEIGHFISNSDGPSHDDKSSDLMYGDSTPTPGTIVRRKRIQRFGRDDK
jgi:hypothetical protein